MKQFIVLLCILFSFTTWAGRGSGSFGGSRSSSSSFSRSSPSPSRSSSFGGSRSSTSTAPSSAARSSTFGGSRASKSPAPITRPTPAPQAGSWRGGTTVNNHYYPGYYGGYGHMGYGWGGYYYGGWGMMDHILFWNLFYPRTVMVAGDGGALVQVQQPAGVFNYIFGTLIGFIFLILGIFLTIRFVAWLDER